MPRESTSRLDFGYGWLRGEDWWGDPMSDNMVMLDALMHPSVVTMTLPAPPDAATVGEQYIVASGAAGLWSGQDGSLATRYLIGGASCRRSGMRSSSRISIRFTGSTARVDQ